MGFSKVSYLDDLKKEIRFFDERDDLDQHSGKFPGLSGSCARVEFSDRNREELTKHFMKIKDNCEAILEIGVCRNNDRSSTYSFLNNKNDDTVYIGIDIQDKSFLNNEEKNIHTMKVNSSNFQDVINFAKSKGVEKFDFIFIDGWHSINQVIDDWRYTELLSEGGIVGFHDVTRHPGPFYFFENLNTDKWETTGNLSPEDNGIGFCWKK